MITILSSIRNIISQKGGRTSGAFNEYEISHFRIDHNSYTSSKNYDKSGYNFDYIC